MLFVWGFTGAYTLNDPTPQGPQGLHNAPPADPGRAQHIAFRWWDPVTTYATFHVPETSFGPHFNTFLAWVETRGHRASHEMYDVHLDRSGAGPISSPIPGTRNSKATAGMCSSRRIEKCPQNGWGCMGGQSYGASSRGSCTPGPAAR